MKFLSKATILKLYNFWPPFLFGGVHVGKVSADLKYVCITLTLRPWNKNYVGTHFGGLLYAMVDAPYMIMVLENIGPGYIVWDKAAHIDFIKPGRGKVTAEFVITDQQLQEIKDLVQASEKGKIHYTLPVVIKDEDQDIVCKVDKVLYIRKKN